MFRRKGDALEVLLVHPGGPFFARKDEGAWTIPKGEVLPGEDLLARAQIEFEEESGRAEGGLSLDRSSSVAARPFTPGLLKAICLSLSNSNRTRSK